MPENPRPKPRPFQFDAIAHWIREECGTAAAAMEKQAMGSAKPRFPISRYYEPASVLKRLVYRHIRYVVSRGKLEKLKAHIRARDGANAWPDTSNPFVWGLRLIDGPGRGQQVDKRRSKYALELKYAADHDIDWRNLDFFLAFAGHHALIQKKASAQPPFVEDWAEPLKKREKAA